jgi:hypothetical protein
LAGNFFAFSTTGAENDMFRADLKDRLAVLREEYSTLLYGGKMLLAVSREVHASCNCTPLLDLHAGVLIFHVYERISPCICAERLSAVVAGGCQRNLQPYCTSCGFDQR